MGLKSLILGEIPTEKEVKECERNTDLFLKGIKELTFAVARKVAAEKGRTLTKKQFTKRKNTMKKMFLHIRKTCKLRKGSANLSHMKYAFTKT